MHIYLFNYFKIAKNQNISLKFYIGKLKNNLNNNDTKTGNAD